jgi:hypothetical protein
VPPARTVNLEERLMKAFILGMVLVFAAAPAMAQGGGNGAPNGGHYNLNLIGHDDCLGGDFTGSNRHVIAVLLNYNDGSQNGQLATTLDKRNKIFLAGGTDFQVTDGSACDGAYFTLPWDVSTAWTVWARALGSPKGNPTGTITTCAIDDMGTQTTADDIIVCSTSDNVVNLVRTKGQQKFSNVSKQLLFLCADGSDGSIPNGTCEQSELVQLFDDDYYGYFWDYDNNGIRLAQLRFYPVVN